MKIALSTGRLPPTPMLQIDAKTQSTTKPGDPAAALANMPTRSSVELKEIRLPQISLPKPKTIAPTSKPMFCDSGRKGPRKWNSVVTGVRMRPSVVSGSKEGGARKL